MAESTGRIIDDGIDWRLGNWGEVVPDDYRRIEAAARMEQLAGVLSDEMDRVADEEGLINQGDYKVLSTVRLAEHRGEPITAIEVARRLEMTAATMVNRIDRLEALGYVRRNPHPLDRRAAYLGITPEGIACAERTVRRRTEVRERYLSALTKRERQSFTRLLRKLAAAWM